MSKFEYRGHGLCRMCGTFRVTWRCTWGETDSMGALEYASEVILHFACDRCLGALCSMMFDLGLGIPLVVGKPY